MTASFSLPVDYRLGIVEGFFGREWSWEDRHHWAAFLAENGFNSYLYAPKADRLLRQQWDQPLPDEHLNQLQSLATACREHGVEFGIGLSPYELYRHFDTSGRKALVAKLESLNGIGADALCILFDDMPGSLDDLAAVQADIMTLAMDTSTSTRFLFCPTYYSDDPVLAKHFGAGPERYLEQLGEKLPNGVDVFWTGPRVISSEYPEPHLRRLTEQLQRKPLLWDNYPVNDSKRLCNFLQLAPAPRDIEVLRRFTRGQMVNPMNQSWLSLLPLAAMAGQYAGAETDETLMEEVFERLAPSDLAELLLQDVPAFQISGLDALTDAEKAGLVQRYQAFSDHPMAREVLDWLNGDYAFDPACLT